MRLCVLNTACCVMVKQWRDFQRDGISRHSTPISARQCTQVIFILNQYRTQCNKGQSKSALFLETSPENPLLDPLQYLVSTESCSSEVIPLNAQLEPTGRARQVPQMDRSGSLSQLQARLYTERPQHVKVWPNCSAHRGCERGRSNKLYMSWPTHC